MVVEGTRLSLLQAVADIQGTTSQKVEDVELAEKVDMDLGLIRSVMNDLAQAGYIDLEKIDRISGVGYCASMTPQGRTALQEVHQKAG